MVRNAYRKAAAAVVVAVGLMAATGAGAATCGDTSGGFEQWKVEFSREAGARGVSAGTLDALMAATYSNATISADRGQKSFRLSLDQFMSKRGGPAIAKRGAAMKRTYGDLFASIEQSYGVPPGPLIAIWGMETGFGKVMGKQKLLSAVATLAYDCRRSDFFTDQLYATLTLIERGALAPTEKSSMHGEIGQTQFLPKSVLLYGRGDMDTPQGALTSTANFLRAHGWQPGAGYQPGEPNFAAIQAWNAATVYQQAIALIAGQIDGVD